MTPKPKPPPWAERFLTWFCKPDLLEYILGDLEEAFEDHVETLGEKKAKRHFVREVFGLFRFGIIRNLELSHYLTSIAMMATYFKIAFRQIKKHKLFASLNIFGLATSLSVCLLIIMILADQYSYDHFHEKKDNIFRVISSMEERPVANARFATTPASISEELKSDYPWVEKSTRVIMPWNNAFYKNEALDTKGIWVDPEFLDIFSFGWSKGDRNTALDQPFSIVISEKMVENYFKEEEPLGKMITFPDYGDFVITGVIPEVNQRSHLQFDYMVSLSSMNSLGEVEKNPISLKDWETIYRNTYVYFLMNEKGNLAMADASLGKIASDWSEKKEDQFWHFESQNVTDISPGNDLSNDLYSTPSIIMYFLMTLGILIILTACFNYTNLSLARAVKRSKEIGVRKVVGAKRRQIILQFIIESVVIALCSLAIALVFLEFLIHGFYNLDAFVPEHFLLGKTLNIYLLFVIFSIVIGIIAGLLPAWRLSSFHPIQVLKISQNLKVFSKFNFRKVLVVSQFVLSIVFIITTITILRQQDHILQTDLGFDKNNLLNVYLYDTDYEIFKQRISQINQVQEISGAKAIPISGEVNMTKMYWENKNDSLEISYNYVTSNWIENLDIPFICGQTFPTNTSAQNEQFIILNELAAQSLGYEKPNEALGQMLQVDTSLVSIIGVVKNFRYENIWDASIQPHLLRYNPNQIRSANVKLSGIDQEATFRKILAEWNLMSPHQSLNSYYFDDRIYYFSKFFKMGSKIVGLVGFLAIVIACLGLLGMVTYAVEGKVKEVGIRKVLGASEKNLVWLLSKGFIFLLGLAICIAIPISILVNNFWLNNFADRIAMSPMILLGGAGVIFLLAILTVISKTWWAAKSNPVGMLRSE